MVMFVIFASVLVLMLLGVTTAVTMGFASAATFLLAGGDMARLFLVPQRMFAQVSGITLMSIPFFLLMGNLMTEGGVSKSLFAFGRVSLGHRWGGLSNAAIAACIVMAAMSGSAAACAAGIGMIAVAEMKKSGYGEAFSCATIAAGGALGPIIPPSITLILYDERQRPFCRGRRARAHHRVCLHAVVLVRLPHEGLRQNASRPLARALVRL